VMKSQP